MLLGDPHLGKTFINGVPLARRGEREAMVWAAFEQSLWNVGEPWHINMGDLFDAPVVPYSVVLRAAQTYLFAAQQQPDTTFVILQGNHDITRDLERCSAFDVFAEIVEGQPNIMVVREPVQIDGRLFVPFDPAVSAADLVQDFRAVAAYGHWDIESFGGSDHNLIPTAVLAKNGILTAYTGHVHAPSEFTRDGVLVTVVGSMQPYAHGEGEMYVTLTLAEARARTDLRDKCVRIKLQPGETCDFEPDCLQLKVVPVGDDQESTTVTLGDFDIHKLFAQAFDQVGVTSDLRQRVKERYEAAKITE